MASLQNNPPAQNNNNHPIPAPAQHNQAIRIRIGGGPSANVDDAQSTPSSDIARSLLDQMQRAIDAIEAKVDTSDSPSSYQLQNFAVQLGLLALKSGKIEKAEADAINKSNIDKIRQLTEERDGLKRDNEWLGKEADQLEQENNVFEQNLENLGKEKDELGTENKLLQNRIDTLQRQVETLNDAKEESAVYAAVWKKAEQEIQEKQEENKKRKRGDTITTTTSEQMGQIGDHHDDDTRLDIGNTGKVGGSGERTGKGGSGGLGGTGGVGGAVGTGGTGGPGGTASGTESGAGSIIAKASTAAGDNQHATAAEMPGPGTKRTARDGASDPNDIAIPNNNVAMSKIQRGKDAPTARKPGRAGPLGQLQAIESAMTAGGSGGARKSPRLRSGAAESESGASESGVGSGSGGTGAGLPDATAATSSNAGDNMQQ